MPDLLARSFQFRVTLSQSPPNGGAEGATFTDGAFSECTGLDMEMDVGEYVEGGRNNGVLQHVGRVKVSRITLRRGMFFPIGGRVNTELWRWFQDVVDGVRPVRRYDGTITILDDGRRAVASWRFVRGLPARLVGPQLNAATGAVAIEELQIAHEGLRMEAS
jgi:phage tail-like protein